MSKGTHDYASDPRNETIRISVNGELFARHEARVSVFDSGFVLGDGVWEGLRPHDGGLPFLTGTFAGVVPAREIDGRVMAGGKRGPMVERLQQLYMELVASESRSGQRV